MKPTFHDLLYAEEPVLVFAGAHIYTTGSFCEKVVREESAFFDTKGAVLISGLEKVRLLKTLIDGLSKDNPLKRYRGDVYAELHPFARLFSLMKREGFTPEEIGTPAAEQFEVFRQLMRDAGKYDADDRVDWVVTAFEQNPTLLLKYKEQLQYTTGIQNRLIRLLAGNTETPEMNMQAISQEVEKLLQQGVLPEKIAIIGQGATGPFYTKRTINFLGLPVARKVINILRYIAAELETLHSGEELLFMIMHDESFHIPPADAAKICRQAADQRTSIRAYLKEPRIPSLFSIGPHENALHLSHLLEKWVLAAQQIPLPELLAEVLHEKTPAEQQTLQPLTDLISHTNLPLTALIETLDLAGEIPVAIQYGNQQDVHLLSPELAAEQSFEHVFFLSREKEHIPDQAPEIEKMDPLFIDPLLSGFAMSATILNNYLRCPLAFFYQQLIKVPMGRKESLAFGSAAHFALEKLFQKMQATEVFPPVEVFLQDFSTYMLNNRASFTVEAFERRMEYGHRMLRSYYDKYVHEWNTIVSVERTIRNISVNGVPVKGKIDKLEFDGNRVNIVDYKTGDYERTKRDWKKFSPPVEDLPEGGDYWRQAVFYKILLDNYKQKSWQVVSTEFDFIEPGRNGEYFKEKINITPADITTVTQQITASWERIRERDFYTGCGKWYCEWCNFVKDNRLQVALHTLVKEE